MKKILVVDNHPLVLKFMSNLITKNGHEVKTAHDGLAALKIIPIFEENQNRLPIVLHDATERAIAEKVKRENEKLKNTIELSEVARHDLNEPLMAIMGYSELLILSKSKDDPLYVYIEKITKQIEKIKKITKKSMNTPQ